MSKTLVIVVAVTAIVAAITSYLVSEYRHRKQQAANPEPKRHKGLIGFAQLEPLPV